MYNDGSAGRAYSYVTDVASGIVGALEFAPPAVDGVRFEVFNLGNSHPVTLNEMIAAIEKATNCKANRSPQPMQPRDVQLTWAELTKPKGALGYAPARTFDQDVEKFVECYRSVPATRRA
jgi:UDP-glucuronate 4-epimerase